MKLTAYWKHFLGQVNLNQSRIDQLDDRVTAITSFLQGANGFGADAEDVIPQGSYAQKTIIKPVGAHEFDADALLQMTEQDGWEPRDYVAELYRTFRGSSTYKELVGRRTRCVVVNYANEFHVDVVPYLVRDDGHWITNRSENKLENMTAPASRASSSSSTTSASSPSTLRQRPAAPATAAQPQP